MVRWARTDQSGVVLHHSTVCNALLVVMRLQEGNPALYLLLVRREFDHGKICIRHIHGGASTRNHNKKNYSSIKIQILIIILIS